MAEPVADRDPETVHNNSLSLTDVWRYHRDRACAGALTAEARTRHAYMAGVLHAVLSDRPREVPEALPLSPMKGVMPIEEALDQAAMFAMENSHKTGWEDFNYPQEWLKRRAQLVAALGMS